jgi:cytochrome c553
MKNNARSALLTVAVATATASGGFAAPALAAVNGSIAVDPMKVVMAPEPFRYCAVCHGVELTGNRAVDAPRLAGLPAWYLTNQMQAFRNGWRGAHPEDPKGMEMRPQATVLTPAQVTQAVAYAASVPLAPPAPPTVAGDAQRGEALYETCAVCHGARGEGSQALSAPPLAGQSDWYLVTQLAQFRSGARGTAPGDVQGAVMRASALVLPDDEAIADVVAYVNTLQEIHQGASEMNRKTAAATVLALSLSGAAIADVTRYPLPNSDFPIAQAVEIPPGSTLIYHSGIVPGPANPEAERFSPEFWGDTEAQAMSVFARIEESLTAKGLGFGDVVKMQVFLVAPSPGAGMDFNGFMNAYRRFFGTEQQPNLPARSAFEIAGLASPGMLVEVEVVLVRPTP